MPLSRGCLSVGLRTTYATTILTNAGVGVWDGLTQQLRDLNCTKCDFPAKNCLRSHLGHVDRSALPVPDSHLTQLLLDTCFGPCSPAPLGLSFCEERCRWAVSNLHMHLEKQARNRMRRGGHHISNPIYWHDQPLLTTFKKWRVLKAEIFLLAQFENKKYNTLYKIRLLKQYLPPIESEPPSRWYLVENRKNDPL